MQRLLHQHLNLCIIQVCIANLDMLAVAVAEKGPSSNSKGKDIIPTDPDHRTPELSLSGTVGHVC